LKKRGDRKGEGWGNQDSGGQKTGTGRPRKQGSRGLKKASGESAGVGENGKGRMKENKKGGTENQRQLCINMKANVVSKVAVKTLGKSCTEEGPVYVPTNVFKG